MTNKALISLAAIFISQSIMALDLGNNGKVFDVQEHDIREVILARLNHMKSEGSLDKLEKALQEDMTKRIIRPKPVLLTTTRDPKAYYVNPEIMVNENITTPDGQLIAKKGVYINPFDYVTYRKTLFFFDADDKEQRAWVKKHYKDYELVKFILTKGDIADASEKIGRIYFDMGGKLSRYYHLRHVPAVVVQDKKQWKIQEIGVGDA
ncbi:MAG: type-F conjugative transfer system protein TraW [Legionella sp.]|nr:MAG: type-F conjugative transfer system protein TraW [Legionella sp.]